LSDAELADIFADPDNVLKRVDEPDEPESPIGTGGVVYIDSCDTSGNIVINQSDTTFRLTNNLGGCQSFHLLYLFVYEVPFAERQSV